ncbi:MAG: VOC family protein [Pseudomonadota bacterium]|nr:VOC family protein [Pseudomonadota bacterium]
MRLFKTTHLVSVIPTADFSASRQWYARFLGEPDETPSDGMAEWLIADNAWLQLDSNANGQTAVIIGVENVAACRQALLQVDVAAADIVDYGFVQVCNTQDPHGNRVSFVQIM